VSVCLLAGWLSLVSDAAPVGHAAAPFLQQCAAAGVTVPHSAGCVHAPDVRTAAFLASLHACSMRDWVQRLSKLETPKDVDDPDVSPATTAKQPAPCGPYVWPQWQGASSHVNIADAWPAQKGPAVQTRSRTGDLLATCRRQHCLQKFNVNDNFAVNQCGFHPVAPAVSFDGDYYPCCGVLVKPGAPNVYCRFRPHLA